MGDETKTLGQQLVGLPAGERARRYREFAGEAMLRAELATDAGMRAEYFSLAAAWHAMASELERGEGYVVPTGEADWSKPDGRRDGKGNGRRSK